MDLTELETKAKNGEDFPKGISYEEHELFANFRVLYFLLRNKQVTVEEARQEKALYLAEYKVRRQMVEQFKADIECKAIIQDIINRYGGIKDVPPRTLEYLLQVLDGCLYFDKTNTNIMMQIDKYLGVSEWATIK